MEIKSPFSINDFLGYFIPGTIFLFIIFLSIQTLQTNETAKLNYINIINSINYLLNSSNLTNYIYFIIISYLIGHLFNYLSSISIEQYSVWRYGYPTYYLINEKPLHYLSRYSKKNIRPIIKDIITPNKLSKKKLTYLILIYLKKIFYRLKIRSVRRIYRIRLRSGFWRIFLLLIIFPIYIYDKIFGSVLGLKLFYTNQIDNKLAKILKDKVNNILIKYNITEIRNFDYYFLLHQYYQEKYPEYRKKSNLCNAQYRLCRSLSLIFCVSANIFFISYFYANPTNETIILMLFFGFNLLAFIFFMAFMKFYRLQTKLLFTCILIDDKFDL